MASKVYGSEGSGPGVTGCAVGITRRRDTDVSHIMLLADWSEF